MRILTIYTSIALILGLYFTAVSVAQEPPKKIALLVGVADYLAENVGDLKFAENDIRVVGGQLKLMGFEVTSLTGKEATRKQTIATIDSFMEAASELESSDIVFVMFSGHGQQIQVREETDAGSRITEVPYFCPVDTLHFDETKTTTRGKSETEIAEELNLVSLNRVLRGMDETSNSLNNLLVVDACRNNPSKGKSSGISGTSANVPSGVNILFAASSGQKSWESADKKVEHGVFTHFLIKGLQGKAGNSRGQVTWSRLSTYLQEEVAYAGPDLAGGKGRVQNPHSIINSSNLIVLGKPVRRIASSSDSWTRFRGPNGQGKIAYSNIPFQWSETENIRWKYKLPGAGASSPIVFDGQVFVTAYSGCGKYADKDAELVDLKKHLVAIDIESGRKNWMVTIDGVGEVQDSKGMGVGDHGYTSHTPVTDGENVYAYMGRSGIYAFDLAGKKIWHRSQKSSRTSVFGSAASPIIFEDMLIVSAGCEDRRINALDSSNGNLIWTFEEEALNDTSSTPIIVENGRGFELVVQMMGKCAGLDAKTGVKRWEFYKGGGSNHQAGSPIKAGGYLVFPQSYSGIFGIANEQTKRPKIESQEWFSSIRTFSTPVATEGEILCFDGFRSVLLVLDAATGERVDRQRLKGSSGDRASRKTSGRIRSSSSFSSPILVGEHVIVVFGKGDAFVINKEGETYKTKFINRLGDEEETFLATPAVTENELLIRSDKYLYCISKN